MKRFTQISLLLTAFAASSCLLAQSPTPEDTRPVPQTTAITPQPTPTPCDSVMPKERQPATAPEQSSGPISGQAAASGTSKAVRDLPPPKPGTPQPPREINPLNTEPVKGIKPDVMPCNESTLSTPIIVQDSPKKKPIRKKRIKPRRP